MTIRAATPGTPPKRATANTLSAGHMSGDTQSEIARANREEGVSGQSRADAQGSSAATAFLRLAAESLNDVEAARLAAENRLRAWDQAGVPVPAGAEGLVDALRTAEHQAELDLKRALRAHPLGGWVKRTMGIGEKQGARLIAAIGDPRWNAAADRPRRGPAELWAYCGYHCVSGGQAEPGTHGTPAPGNVAARRRKGQKANWNTEAKTRAFLCAEACMKCRRSPFRAVYDAARERWADRDTTDGHKHNHALRLTAKAILRDLYLEAAT